jgi:hypothetical protein
MAPTLAPDIGLWLLFVETQREQDVGPAPDHVYAKVLDEFDRLIAPGPRLHADVPDAQSRRFHNNDSVTGGRDDRQAMHGLRPAGKIRERGKALDDGVTRIGGVPAI